MKIVYKSILDRINYEIERHLNREDCMIDHFLLTKEEFKEFVSEPVLIEQYFARRGVIEPVLFAGTPQEVRVRCCHYYKDDILYWVVEESKKLCQ